MKLMLAALVACLAAVPAHTQDKRPNDPGDPAAPVPPLRHESVLAGYHSSKDAKPAPWKETNAAIAGASHAGRGKAGGSAPQEPAANPEPAKSTAPPTHSH